MKNDNLIFLKHIEQSIADIFGYTKGVSKADFLKDKKLGDAVTRKVEILGEAVKNLPAGFRNRHQEIPWSEIARTRDKLIHQYFGVDIDINYGPLLKKTFLL